MIRSSGDCGTGWFRGRCRVAEQFGAIRSGVHRWGSCPAPVGCLGRAAGFGNRAPQTAGSTGRGSIREFGLLVAVWGQFGHTAVGIGPSAGQFSFELLLDRVRVALRHTSVRGRKPAGFVAGPRVESFAVRFVASGADWDSIHLLRWCHTEFSSEYNHNGIPGELGVGTWTPGSAADFTRPELRWGEVHHMLGEVLPEGG